MCVCTTNDWIEGKLSSIRIQYKLIRKTSWAICYFFFFRVYVFSAIIFSGSCVLGSLLLSLLPLTRYVLNDIWCDTRSRDNQKKKTDETCSNTKQKTEIQARDFSMPKSLDEWDIPPFRVAGLSIVSLIFIKIPNYTPQLGMHVNSTFGWNTQYRAIDIINKNLLCFVLFFSSFRFGNFNYSLSLFFSTRTNNNQLLFTDVFFLVCWL